MNHIALLASGGPERPTTTTTTQRPDNPTRRRWYILRQQLAEGHEPCFSTDKRHGCPESCCWRAECQALRAEWRR